MFLEGAPAEVTLAYHPPVMAHRASGILLHPTALPGPYGNGDFGPPARRFLRMLSDGGQSVWQVLPLGPTDGGWEGGPGSPYDCRSAFAGNGSLISPEELVAEGLLDELKLEDRGTGASRRELLEESWREFSRSPPKEIAEDFREFREAAEQRFWLDDWAVFWVLHRHYRQSWLDWPEPLRDRDPSALGAARDRWAEEIAFEGYVQFLFHRQWQALRRRASALGVRVCGDMPIYVSLDSADVWAHRELFELDRTGRPTEVAGVPPDYFSATGQRWGNPLYRWSRHREEGFDWWLRRVESHLRAFDVLRIDHFRGFAQYWAVPAQAETAEGGSWRPGPGRALFDALAVLRGEDEGPLPLIAEDLGEITPDVRELLAELGLPGMKVLQFAFSTLDSEHLPHFHTRNCVVYTGTHDNDTTRSWFEGLGTEERERAADYLGVDHDVDPARVPWQLIRCALESVADLAIVPLQDVLGLGEEARFNTPATVAGNWSWQVSDDQLSRLNIAWLRRLTELTGRCPPSAVEQAEVADGMAERQREEADS